MNIHRPRSLRAPLIAAAAAFASALLAGCSGGEPEEKVVHGGTAADHGAALFRDPAVAKTSFNAYACSTCHEAKPGDAGSAILPGAPLAGAPKRPSYWGGEELDLLRAINNCLYYFMLKDSLWTPDDEDARAMFAYLTALPSGSADEQPVPFTPVYKLTTPPPGDAARGESTYKNACRSCHGDAHTGASRLVERASILPEQVLSEHPLGEYTEAERRIVFIEKTRHGGFVGYGGQMPPFSLEALSEQDLGDLLAFFDFP